jgi:hypothetical protein
MNETVPVAHHLAGDGGRARSLEHFRKSYIPKMYRIPTHSAEKRGMDGAQKSIAKAKIL